MSESSSRSYQSHGNPKQCCLANLQDAVNGELEKATANYSQKNEGVAGDAMLEGRESDKDEMHRDQLREEVAGAVWSAFTRATQDCLSNSNGVGECNAETAIGRFVDETMRDTLVREVHITIIFHLIDNPAFQASEEDRKKYKRNVRGATLEQLRGIVGWLGTVKTISDFGRMFVDVFGL